MNKMVRGISATPSSIKRSRSTRSNLQSLQRATPSQRLSGWICRFADVAFEKELTDTRIGSSVCMTDYLIAARAAIIFWTTLAVLPAEIVFDAIEAELERRGIVR